MIEVKINIDFNKALKEVKTRKLSETLNKEISGPIAEQSTKYIQAGKVKPQLSINNPRGQGAKPLFDTGKLANSLKGGPKGISGVSYCKEHRRKGGYKWEEKDIRVRQREFITAALPSQDSKTNKIYKEFQDKFVKLLSKRIRKR